MNAPVPGPGVSVSLSSSLVWLSRTDYPTFASATEASSAVLSRIAPSQSFDPPILHDTGRGAILARSAQRVDGIDVFRGGLTVAMTRSFEPVAASGLVAQNLDRGSRGFEKDAIAALQAAHVALTGQGATFRALDTKGDYQRFASVDAAQPARAKRVYFPHEGGLEPAWFVELLLTNHQAQAYVISAITGKVLFANDLVRNDAFTYRVWADSDSKIPYDGPEGNDAIPLVVPQNNGYQLTCASQQLVTLQNFPFSKNDPWLPSGATFTSGNNVDAFSDSSPPDGFTPMSTDTASTATSASTFDWVTDSSISAGTTEASVKAGITQLFYTLNFLHDWYYDSGFDEKSGNHQLDNFGRGGADSDPLIAETIDFSGRDNANAYTPADGQSPVIRMFLFSGQTTASLTVNAPAALAGVKSVGVSGEFGQDTFSVSGPVVLADDGVAPDNADACEPLPGSVAHQIVLAHRGNCSFVQKAQIAANAGALALIVDNVPSSTDPATPPFMGGTASNLTLPILSLNLADGQALESACAGGANVAMSRDPAQDLDGALDDQIVVHEWGHVLSNRLIGDGSGIDTNQARGLGEGWSDFGALLFTARANDLAVAANPNWSGVYPIGSYATSGSSPFYFGLRRIPYSTDMTKDPLTFQHIQDGVALPLGIPYSFGDDGSSNSEIHNTGEIWATMLWECYAALLNSGRYSFADAQARMKDYYVGFLKMTPPSPTFIQARDAVLATAFATEPQDFDLFWKAFAKRGEGVGAVGPDAQSVDNTGVVESYSVSGAASVISVTLADDVLTCDHDGIVDEGEIGTLLVTLRNSGASTLSATTATLSSQTGSLSFVDASSVTFEPLAPFATKTASLKVFLDGMTDLDPAILSLAVDDPTFPKGGALAVTLPTHHGVDEVPQSSTKDDVEPTHTAWTVTGYDVTGTSVKWHRITSGTNHSWFVPNAEESADHRLTSPGLQVTNTQFTLAWKHRWSFESDAAAGIDYDGGVVEITIDAGQHWVDLSTYAKMDYNTTLANDPDATMVLKGRPAYGHNSPGYPDQWVNSNITVTLPQPQLTAFVRFRHGADDNTGAWGWEIDDISVTGIDNTPFTSFVPQRDECDPLAPTALAPPGQTVTSGQTVSLTGTGTSPQGLPVFFSWRQDGGPATTLTGREAATVTFTAPDVSEPTAFVLALRANDGTLVGAPSDTTITVNPTGWDNHGCGCRAVPRGETRGGLAALAAIGLFASRRASRRSRKRRAPV